MARQNKEKLSPSLRLAHRISDELENANYHSLVGVPERIHEAMQPYLGEWVMMKLMKTLERTFSNVR